MAGGAVLGSGVGIADAESDGTVQAQQSDGGETETCDFGSIFDEAIDSVVTIRVFDQQSREFVQGSGWVYAVDGSTATIVTNWHVIMRAAGADVRFRDGDWRPAVRPLGADFYSDLAVMEVEDVPEYVEPLSIADDLPDHGDGVAALGAPIGLEKTMTTGIVSAVERSTTVSFEYFMYNVPSTIQIDAATNPGNSGGPLVDCNAELLGVVFAGTAPTVAENINFAISVSMVERIVPEIIETGSFDHPYMGIQAITVSPMISRLNDIDETTQGVYVEETVEGFAANRVLQGSRTVERETGIPIGGDVIVAIDGTDVDDTDGLRKYLFEETRPSTSVTLSVLREGEQREISLPLTAKPNELERIGIREPTI